jgi:hypothetical protein
MHVTGTSRSFTGAVLVVALLAGGCETGSQTGTLVGTGLGALVGQAAGGDTEATLIGAAVGAGVGYIIGNETDKRLAEEQYRAERGYEAADHGAPPYAPAQIAPLAGTRWRVTSIVPTHATDPYVSKVVEFRPDARLVTTTTLEGGKIEVAQERYRVVGHTLIINKTGYIVNARFEIQGQQLVIDTADTSTLLERLPN